MNSVLKNKFDTILKNNVEKMSFEEQINYITKHFANIVF